MFYLIFGTFWTAITAVITIAFYNAEGVTVNGVWTPADEFAEMLAPKLFLGIFWAVGLIFLFVGIRKIVRNMLTATKGQETYAMVLDILPTGSSVNGNREYKGEFAVISEGSIEYLSEIVGFNKYKYQTGDILLVKHYKKDINFIDRVERHSLPYDVVEKFDNEACKRMSKEEYRRYIGDTKYDEYDNYEDEDRGYNDSDEYIIINGTKYKKVDK